MQLDYHPQTTGFGVDLREHVASCSMQSYMETNISLTWKQKCPTEFFTNSLLRVAATGRNLRNHSSVFP